MHNLLFTHILFETCLFILQKKIQLECLLELHQISLRRNDILIKLNCFSMVSLNRVLIFSPSTIYFAIFIALLFSITFSLGIVYVEEYKFTLILAILLNLIIISWNYSVDSVHVCFCQLIFLVNNGSFASSVPIIKPLFLISCMLTNVFSTVKQNLSGGFCS